MVNLAADWPGLVSQWQRPVRAESPTIRQNWSRYSAYQGPGAHWTSDCHMSGPDTQHADWAVSCHLAQISGSALELGLGQRSYHRSSCRCVAAVCGTMQLSQRPRSWLVVVKAASGGWGWPQSRRPGPGEVSGLFWDCTYPRHRGRPMAGSQTGSRGAICRYSAQLLSRTPQVRKQANNVWQGRGEKLAGVDYFCCKS